MKEFLADFLWQLVGALAITLGALIVAGGLLRLAALWMGGE